VACPGLLTLAKPRYPDSYSGSLSMGTIKTCPVAQKTIHESIFYNYRPSLVWTMCIKILLIKKVYLNKARTNKS
jgi:hypothetical protein